MTRGRACANETVKAQEEELEGRVQGRTSLTSLSPSCERSCSFCSGPRRESTSATPHPSHGDLERDRRRDKAVERRPRLVRARLQALERRVLVELVHLRAETPDGGYAERQHVCEP